MPAKPGTRRESTHPASAAKAITTGNGTAKTAIARAAARLEAAGITTTVPAEEHWTIDWSTELPQEWAEDLLYAVRFCPEQVTTIGARRYRGEHGILFWDTDPEGPVFRRSTGACAEGRSLVWLLPAEFFPDSVAQTR